MIGIEINSEFLDLPEAIIFEIVRNSPYFNNDEIEGEFSLPISIPYSDKNYRLLSYTGNHYKTHVKQKIDATLYGGPNFTYAGTLVIDAFEKNNNQPGSLIASGIFVFGISSFLQQVKDKKLSDLTLGGVRNFTYTTGNPYDGSGGFWQHVHAVAAAPGEYTFAPIKNDGYGAYPGRTLDPFGRSIDWMNKLDMTDRTNFWFDFKPNAAALCPAVSITYLLTCIMEENGWKLQGDILTDATFSKLYAQSFRSIFWCNYSTTFSIVLGYLLTVHVLSDVDIDLKEHVPPDYKITDFIIDLKNRYGIAFNFNTNTRVCTANFLKDIVNSPP